MEFWIGFWVEEVFCGVEWRGEGREKLVWVGIFEVWVGGVEFWVLRVEEGIYVGVGVG